MNFPPSEQSQSSSRRSVGSINMTSQIGRKKPELEDANHSQQPQSSCGGMVIN